MKVKIKWTDAISLREFIGKWNDGYIELEAEPVEERQEWEIKFDEKIVVDTYGAKDFIRKEIISKLIDDLDPRFGDNNHQHYWNKRAQEIKAHWLGGGK